MCSFNICVDKVQRKIGIKKTNERWPFLLKVSVSLRRELFLCIRFDNLGGKTHTKIRFRTRATNIISNMESRGAIQNHESATGEKYLESKYFSPYFKLPINVRHK